MEQTTATTNVCCSMHPYKVDLFFSQQIDFRFHILSDAFVATSKRLIPANE